MCSKSDSSSFALCRHAYVCVYSLRRSGSPALHTPRLRNCFLSRRSRPSITSQCRVVARRNRFVSAFLCSIACSRKHIACMRYRSCFCCMYSYSWLKGRRSLLYQSKLQSRHSRRVASSLALYIVFQRCRNPSIYYIYRAAPPCSVTHCLRAICR